MKRIQVLPIVQAIPNNDQDFTIVYPRGTEIIEVVKPIYLAAYFSNFADWYILKPDNDERTDGEYFRYIWVQYCNMQSQNWGMLFKALFSNYDPIDNYDIHEDISETRSHGDKTFTHTPTGTDTSTTTTTNGTGADLPTTESYVSTYNDGNKPHTKVTTSGEVTTSNSVTYAATYDDTTTIEDDTRDVSTHRHGNAGTMTTAEVIRQETELRKSQLAADIVLAGFVEKFMFYSGVIEL